MGLNFGNQLFGAGTGLGVGNRAITFSERDLNPDDFEVIDEQPHELPGKSGSLVRETRNTCDIRWSSHRQTANGPMCIRAIRRRAPRSVRT